MKTHKDLDVWKNAIDFVTQIYRVSLKFPPEEKYGLTSQLRRASVSIPSNIAEGASRKGKKEFQHFLFIALSSAAEVETQLIIANNLDFLSSTDYLALTNKQELIAKMIQGLIKSLN